MSGLFPAAATPWAIPDVVRAKSIAVAGGAERERAAVVGDDASQRVGIVPPHETTHGRCVRLLVAQSQHSASEIHVLDEASVRRV